MLPDNLLSDTNYFPWKKQFDVLFIGYDLCGFIDGTFFYPSPTLADNASNPDYSFWIGQDSLILGALITSLMLEIHQIVGNAENSKEAWERLKNAFANLTRSKVMRIRERMLLLRGNRSIIDHLNDVKGAADELGLMEKTSQ